MAKWFGNIGFAFMEETVPGVYEEKIVSRQYYGDVLRNTRRLQSSSENLNDDITINNEISIVADPFAGENIYAMRYIEFMGSKWKITNVDVQYPRLKLTIGGVYNVQTSDAS